MKSLLSIFFLFFCLSCLSAQENHFIFIQSDNSQPFYVFLNGKLYSSTTNGYIIIPKLSSGNYNFSIGFAKDEVPEQSFECVINDKDVGFNLKNLGDKRWGLSNLQTSEVVIAESGKTDDIKKAINERVAEKNDIDPVISFNKKKKNVDSRRDEIENARDSLENQDVAIKQEQKDEETKADTAIAESQGNDNDEPVYADVKKVFESNGADGLHLAYVEGNSTDTIQVIIPSVSSSSSSLAENNSFPTQTGVSNSSNMAETADNSSEYNTTATTDGLKFLDPGATKDTGVQRPVQQGEFSAAINSKCKDIARDEDYARLRKKMAKETSDDEMINEARKMYRNKCFTTDQIKRLSTLFLSDEGRYNFFNASYNSVADVANYYMLQSEFIDPAFASRFKSLLQ